ncbi:MAG TPA: iron ABC transporter permease [Gammaproteobacteria bacterium]
MHSSRSLRWSPRWSLAVSLLAVLLALPTLTIVSFVFVPAGEIWHHLADTVLKDYVVNSVTLLLGVGVLSMIIGVCTAWLTTLCEFPGRRVLQWALLLPLSAPAYIVAFTYSGMLDSSGPVQSLLRNVTGWSLGDYWFPEIHSLPGAVFILGLVLYPYVYMLARAAFLEQSVCVLEVSRTLGCGPWRSFLTIALPLARPAIVAGLTLVAMETLADYGSVQYLGVSTFTTGIFRTWFGLGDASAAAQLAAVLLGFIFVLVVLERLSRRRARYDHTSNKYSRLPRSRLKGGRGVAAMLFCLLPLTLGFLLPAGQLLLWALQTWHLALDFHFLLLLWNSLWLASVTAMIAITLAVFLAYAQRLNPQASVSIPVRLTGMGYAVPGTVLAVGMMILAGWLDNRVIGWLESCCNLNPGLLLSGTFIALIFTYLARFLSVSLNSAEAGFAKIKPSLDDAARVLGSSPGQIIRRIHLPVMRGTLITAGLLVFVDVLKELPATLVLRPFNFNTLAVRAYELAIDERLAEAASAGLAIVLAGLIPVILLSRSISRSRPGEGTNPVEQATTHQQ